MIIPTKLSLCNLCAIHLSFVLLHLLLNVHLNFPHECSRIAILVSAMRTLFESCPRKREVTTSVFTEHQESIYTRSEHLRLRRNNVPFKPTQPWKRTAELTLRPGAGHTIGTKSVVVYAKSDTTDAKIPSGRWGNSKVSPTLRVSPASFRSSGYDLNAISPLPRPLPFPEASAFKAIFSSLATLVT